MPLICRWHRTSRAPIRRQDERLADLSAALRLEARWICDFSRDAGSGRAEGQTQERSNRSLILKRIREEECEQ